MVQLWVVPQHLCNIKVVLVWCWASIMPVSLPISFFFNLVLIQCQCFLICPRWNQSSCEIYYYKNKKLQWAIFDRFIDCFKMLLWPFVKKKERKKKNRNDKIIPVKIGAVFVDDFHFNSSLYRLDPQKGVVTSACTAVYLSVAFF